MKNKFSTIFVMPDLINIEIDFDEYFYSKFNEWGAEEKKKFFPFLYSEIEKNRYFSFCDQICFDLKLNFSFANSLKIFDALLPSCFISDTDLGKNLIAFLSEETDVRFFVYMREFNSENDIEITVKVGADDYYHAYDILLSK